MVSLENETLKRFEVEYEDTPYEFYVSATLKFNNETVTLDNGVFFEDPYTYEKIKIADIKEGYKYIIEFPKNYWDNDEKERQDIRTEYTASFKEAYAKTISKRLGGLQ